MVARVSEDSTRADLETPPRGKLAIAVLVIVLHVVAILALIRAFAPEFTASVTREVVSAFNVTITAPEPTTTPEPAAPAPGSAGDEGAAGKRATPRDIKVIKPKTPVAKPTAAPQATSTGTANASGARDAGDGTGAGGTGTGTGAGGSGSGTGGGIAAKPSVRSGEINNSRDFPVPEGGRQARFGKSVIVHFTVTIEGRARDCRVASSSVDADTTARVCPLVVQKIRFNPATRADGTPVEARYGYRVDFSAR